MTLQFFLVWQATEKVVFLRLLKNGQMQGTRGLSLLVRQAILRNKAYFTVRRNDEG